MEDEESKVKCVRLYKNRSGGQRIGGFLKRNLIEGIAETVVVCAMIIVIPFVLNLKLALVVLAAFGIMFVNLMGYRGKSLLQALWRRASATPRKLKLRSWKDEARKSKTDKTSEYREKIKEYFSDENLWREDAGKPERFIRALKPYFLNLRNGLGL